MAMKVTPLHAALAVSFAALLAGCSLSPEYERPAVDVPADWRAQAGTADVGEAGARRLASLQGGNR